MNTPNETNTETTRQFDRLAPRALKVAGRTFTRNGPTLYDNDDDSVRFAFTARKRPGAFLADKVDVRVSYVRSLDLYDIVLTLVDGSTFDSILVARFDYSTFEVFANLNDGLASLRKN